MRRELRRDMAVVWLIALRGMKEKWSADNSEETITVREKPGQELEDKIIWYYGH